MWCLLYFLFSSIYKQEMPSQDKCTQYVINSCFFRSIKSVIYELNLFYWYTTTDTFWHFPQITEALSRGFNVTVALCQQISKSPPRERFTEQITQRTSQNILDRKSVMVRRTSRVASEKRAAVPSQARGFDLPTVARMRGDESPMFWRHSLLMKSDTPLGKFW